MNVDELADRLHALMSEAETQVPSVGDKDALEALRVAFLGKKGRLTDVLRTMGKLSKDDRPKLGKLANAVRDRIGELLTDAGDRLAAAERHEELQTRIDVTLPGRRRGRGTLHPITQTSSDILAVLSHLGFAVAEGPEIEHDFYNFQSLNMPRDHPARDMQDTSTSTMTSCRAGATESRISSPHEPDGKRRPMSCATAW